MVHVLVSIAAGPGGENDQLEISDEHTASVTCEASPGTKQTA